MGKVLIEFQEDLANHHRAAYTVSYQHIASFSIVTSVTLNLYSTHCEEPNDEEAQ